MGKVSLILHALITIFLSLKTSKKHFFNFSKILGIAPL